MILNFVEEQPYVDFVTCFKMDHIIGSVIKKNVDEAITTTSASILTSAAVHIVHVLETDDCECEDNLVKEPYAPVDTHCDCDCDDCSNNESTTSGPRVKPRPFGIGSFVIGNTFIVGNGIGFDKTGIDFMGIEDDFKVE